VEFGWVWRDVEMKVLLDTNFCLLALEKRVFDSLEGEVLITDFILEEVKKVSPKSAVIIGLLKKNNVKTVKTGLRPKNNDNALIEIAKKMGAAVATNDSGLRLKAYKHGVQTYYLRGGKRIGKS
jgi:rRNA-processing protein FCF1